jgi:16S rRNA (adenine1518-N6/adenine1519-N6)-dimethyltransferase
MGAQAGKGLYNRLNFRGGETLLFISPKKRIVLFGIKKAVNLMKKLYSPAIIKEVMEQHKIFFQKKLGQNFLIDGNVVRNIAETAELDSNDTVVEIGPGIGTLTQELAARAKKVIAIELDRNLLPVLKENLRAYPNVQVVPGDAMRQNFNDLVTNSEGALTEYKIVGNLPYYITTPLIMHVLEQGFNFSVFVLMVQKEVARRIVAAPGTKDYGVLSLAVQYHTVPEMALKVPRAVFMPKPEVDSAVLKLTRRKMPAVSVADEKKLFQIIKAAFGQRRKTLLNALANAGIGPSKDELSNVISRVGLNPGRRGETLSMEEFASITNALD